MERSRRNLLEILKLVQNSPKELNKTELRKAKNFLIKLGNSIDIYLEAYGLDRRPGIIQRRVGFVCKLIRNLETKKENCNEKEIQCERK